MNVFDMTTRNRIGRGNDKAIYNELVRIQIGDILLFGSYYLPGVADPNDDRKKPAMWMLRRASRCLSSFQKEPIPRDRKQRAAVMNSPI